MVVDPLGPLVAQPPLVTFLTDFGLRDPSAGVLSGVVLGIAPQARTLDLTHAIPPFDVEAGAEALVESLVHLPVGAHVAVVDPGVGTNRRPIAIRAPVSVYSCSTSRRSLSRDTRSARPTAPAGAPHSRQNRASVLLSAPHPLQCVPVAIAPGVRRTAAPDYAWTWPWGEYRAVDG